MPGADSDASAPPPTFDPTDLPSIADAAWGGLLKFAAPQTQANIFTGTGLTTDGLNPNVGANYASNGYTPGGAGLAPRPNDTSAALQADGEAPGSFAPLDTLAARLAPPSATPVMLASAIPADAPAGALLVGPNPTSADAAPPDSAPGIVAATPSERDSAPAIGTRSPFFTAATYSGPSSGPGPVALPAGGLQKVGESGTAFGPFPNEFLPTDIIDNSREQIELQDHADHLGEETKRQAAINQIQAEGFNINPDDYYGDGYIEKLRQMNMIGAGNLSGKQFNWNYDDDYGNINWVLSSAKYIGNGAAGYQFKADDAPGAYEDTWQTLTGQPYSSRSPNTFTRRDKFDDTTVTVTQGWTGGRPGTGSRTIDFTIAKPVTGEPRPVSTSGRLIY